MACCRSGGYRSNSPSAWKCSRDRTPCSAGFPGGSVGGTINLVPKRADDQPLTRVSVDWTQRGQLGTHLDIGRRFGENNAFGVRFNGVHRNGDTAVDHQSREFPMLSWA